MFSPICIARVRPLNAEEKLLESRRHYNSTSSSSRKRSGSTFAGRQLGCIRQQADTVLALVSDDIIQSSRGETLDKVEVQLDGCYVPEAIDYRRARRPSMFGAKDGQDPALAQQQMAFKETMLPILRRALKEGIMSTVVAAGAAETGKTFTIVGTKSAPGLLPQTISTLLSSSSSAGSAARLQVSILEVYDETVRDLLDPNPDRRIKVRQTRHRGFSADGGKRVAIEQPGDIFQLIEEAQLMRSVGTDRARSRNRNGHLWVHLFLWSSGTSTGGGSANSNRGGAYSEIVFLDAASSFRESLKPTDSSSGGGLILPPETTTLLHTSSVSKSIRTLVQCCEQMSSFGQYDASAFDALPIMDSILTMMLQQCLLGKHQLIWCACVSASPSERLPTTATLQLASALRYVRYPTLPRAVDPSILQAQLLTEELAAVKQQIKVLETAKQRTATSSGSVKSALLQRLVELTEELQECTMSNEDRHAKQRSLRQQRARALARLRNTAGALPIHSDVPRLVLIPHPTTQPLPPDAELPQKMNNLWDGPNVMGTSLSCAVVVSSPDPDPTAVADAAAPSTTTTNIVMDELDYFLGDAPPPPAAAPMTTAAPHNAAMLSWHQVAPYHCIIGVTELDLELHLAMTLDSVAEDEDGAEEDEGGERLRRVVYVNGERIEQGHANCRLHHLDRIVVGPWVFQLILPLRWRRHQDEVESLQRKKKIRSQDTTMATVEEPLGALFHILKTDIDVQRHLGVNDSSTQPLLAQWTTSCTSFSRKMKTVEHTQLVEAHDRCVAELQRIQTIVSDGDIGKSVLATMSGDVRQLLSRRAAIHKALALEYPAEDACVDRMTGKAQLGLEGYVLDSGVVYDGANAWEEIRLGRALDEAVEEQQRNPDSDDDDDDPPPPPPPDDEDDDASVGKFRPSAAAVIDVDTFLDEFEDTEAISRRTTPPPRGGALPENDDDMFAELDAMILHQQPTTASEATPAESNEPYNTVQKRPGRVVSIVENDDPAAAFTATDGLVAHDTRGAVDDSANLLAQEEEEAPATKRRQSVMRRKSIIVAPVPDEEEEGDDWEAPPDAVEGGVADDNSFVPAADASTSSDTTSKGGQQRELFSAEQLRALAPLLSDVTPGQEARELQAALQRELTAFHDELVRCRRWQPEGPPAHLPEDQAMYQASVSLRIKRGDIPAADTQLAGRIFKLRIRRSMFHRGGFYEVDAYVTNHYLVYFSAATGTTVAAPPGAGGGNEKEQCLGSCYLYGARLELLAVGEMKYCILITSVTPRKPTKDKNKDSAENRVVLGFATRPLQLEWLEKLRCAVIPKIPTKWAKYFGSEAPRFLLLDDEAGLYAPPDAQSVSTESVHHVDVNATHHVAAHTTKALAALRSLSICMTALDGPMPTQVTTLAAKEVAKWQDTKTQELQAKFEKELPNHHNTEEPLAPGVAFDALFQLKQEPSEDDLVLRSEATRLLCAHPTDDVANGAGAASPPGSPRGGGTQQTASNFMRMAEEGSAGGTGGGFHAAQSMADQRRDPSSVVPLRQVPQYHLLKHYFKATPQLLLGTATSVDVSEEFHIAADLQNNRVVDGNMSVAQRDLLFAGGAWSSSSEGTRLATSSDDVHFLLVDHFKGSIEFVHPSNKKATVFYGKELLHIMPSFRDPRLVLLVLFHVKPYVYAELFPSFGERQHFINSLETLRPTKRLYAPWLLPLHKRSDVARGGVAECNTIIDGVGAEAVVLPRSGGLLPHENTNAASSSPLASRGGLLPHENTNAASSSPLASPRGSTSSSSNNGLRLEGEVRIAVTSVPTQTLSMWVGCWNLGGVPFHSEDAIYHWATMHLPTAGSMEDILVFSLQAVGGLSEERKKYKEKNSQRRRTVSTGAAAAEEKSAASMMSSIAVTPVMAIGEHICAALRKREHNNASYRLLKGIASDDEDAEDALIVIAKDHIAVHVSSVQAQVLSCSTKHASAPGSGLAVALGIGRSNVCFVSVRLPAVSATSSSFVAKEAAIVRQQRMVEYLSQVRLGDPIVDASVFFDAVVVCGDLGESASDQFLGQTTTPTGGATTTAGGVKGTALQWFAEIQPTYPPTCPVVLGSRNVLAASLASAGQLPSKKSAKDSGVNLSTGSTAVCRQLSYSGRVVYRDNAQYVVVAQGSSDNTSTKKKASSRTASGSSVTTTASLVPLLQQTVPSAGASSAARTAALCVAESLPMSWVSAWTFLRSTALSYEPLTASSSSSSSVSSSRCKNPQPLCTVVEVRVCFPSPAVRPALLQQLRLYLSSRHGLVQPVHVTGAVVKVLEDIKSDSVTCVFSLSPPSSSAAAALAISTTTSDRTLLRNEDMVLSFVWGLSGSKANVAGSTKIALAKLLAEHDDQEDNSTKATSFVITGLCLERGSKAIGDVSLTLQRIHT
ncbi:kinesin, putative [Bodo saltans]|uniref:Kinesin, putative n=1 Tax=Bodo saltans TaxID=75058 RepID=A0A0S4JM15_BODSA|nr:kinesin, putative [Bodo saltans]|eukprot:CUG91171.1 kinesin, putative [Bodo saltans]